MNNKPLIAALHDAAAHYPAMQPTDAVKLLYHGTFGSGHLVTDEENCRERIEREWAAVPPSDAPIETLGRFARLPLATAKYDGLSSRTVARLFMTAANHPGSADDFHASLAILADLTDRGEMPFSPASLRAYLADYRLAGEPPVSHSEAYRAAYAPSYRLIPAEAVRLLPVISAVGKELQKRAHVTLAIDGRCASGKTTAAGILAGIFDGAIVHLDDFFLPREKRTPDRLAAPGGNIDIERILDEIIQHTGCGEGFSYRRYDCHTDTLLEKPVEVMPSRLLIVEGSYAMHPALGRYADLAVFSDIAPDEQLLRIASRGDDPAVFRSRWIPMEEQYFTKLAIRQKADLILT